MNTNTLEDFIACYAGAVTEARSNTNIELEMRAGKLDCKSWIHVAEYMLSKSTNPIEFSNTANFIGKNPRKIDGNIIRTLHLGTAESAARPIAAQPEAPGPALKQPSGPAVRSEFMAKSHIRDPFMMSKPFPCRLVLSTETKLDAPGISQWKLIRWKSRISTQLPDCEGWRLDLTRVIQMDFIANAEKLPALRDDIFTAKTPAELIAIPPRPNEQFELEIEYVGASVDLTSTRINEMLARAMPFFMDPTSSSDELVARLATLVSNSTTAASRYLSQNAIGNKAIAINKNTYANMYPPTNWWISDKSDGDRVIVYIEGSSYMMLYGNSRKIGAVAGELAREITIADCEQLADGRTLIFDVMWYNGAKLTGKMFGERIAVAPAVCEILRSAILNVDWQCKKYTRLPDGPAGTAAYVKKLESAVRETWESNQRNWPVDGLMLIRPDRAYNEPGNYKWKPASHNTIDFYAARCPESLLGTGPFVPRTDNTVIHLLFVSITAAQYNKFGLSMLSQRAAVFPVIPKGPLMPIQFSSFINPFAFIWHAPQDLQVNHKIVELRANSDGWEYVRTREDRMTSGYYGNKWDVAELIYINHFNPFELSDIWLPNAGYFKNTATTMYMAPNKVKREIVSTMLRAHLMGAEWMIDEAAGRGGDLHRYAAVGIKNALFIDIDANAIAELITRRLNINVATGVSGGVDSADEIVTLASVANKTSTGMSVHTLVADLCTPAATLGSMVYSYGCLPNRVNGILCNFALHYLCDSLEHIRNILVWNYRMLQPGGVFIFTVLDGGAVWRKLHDTSDQNVTDGAWELYQDGAVKYRIVRKWAGDVLADFGQTISVLLPFSADAMYDEPLCNLEAVLREATSLKWKVLQNDNMRQFASRGEVAKLSELMRAMTANDLEYLEMHRVVVLQK